VVLTPSEPHEKMTTSTEFALSECPSSCIMHFAYPEWQP